MEHVNNLTQPSEMVDLRGKQRVAYISQMVLINYENVYIYVCMAFNT